MGVWGRESYITLGSPCDVTAFHKMKYGGRGFYITLFSPSDVTAFHRIDAYTDKLVSLVLSIIISRGVVHQTGVSGSVQGELPTSC